MKDAFDISGVLICLPKQLCLLTKEDGIVGAGDLFQAGVPKVDGNILTFWICSLHDFVSLHQIFNLIINNYHIY